MANKNKRYQQQASTNNKTAKSVNSYIAPVQMQRIRQNVLTWREGIQEAELAYFPFRVKMQRMYADTVLNGHVEACMNKRRNLTLLRDFAFYNDGSKEPNEQITDIFKTQWFFNCLTHIIDSIFYGYNLISLGDIVNDKFPKLDIIKRWNVSPDRLNVAKFIYGMHGMEFMKNPYRDWHVYVSTPGDNGVSVCGYGLLYKVGIYEIFCRNLLGFNGDFVELYSQPYRVGKTTKTEEAERDEFEMAIRSMGSAGYAIIDPTDEIAFLETKLGGTGWQGYENLEQRCEKKISKILLGHADAIDSVPGKLGNDGEKSSAQLSLEEIQVTDGRFAETVINDILLVRLRALGFIIPDGRICFKNDGEQQEIRRQQDEANKRTAETAETMSKAGLQMDEKYFTERTGIPCKKKEEPKQQIGKPTKFDPKVKNKLDELYR